MNSKGHLIISIVKSIVRILGAVWSIKYKDFMILAGCIAMAEALGILEELVDRR